MTGVGQPDDGGFTEGEAGLSGNPLIVGSVWKSDHNRSRALQ
jgi:hypothetical protein